jgi:hypothetical protein
VCDGTYKNNMQYLSLTAIVKKEHHYIKEWLAYYKSIGVEKFYIFNNNKPDKTKEEILKLPFYNDIVVLDFVNKTPDKQKIAYKASISKYGKKTEWMIFCDVDEFFMFNKQTDLKEFLHDYRKHSAVVVPWYLYGSSNHIKRPVPVKGTICLSSYLYRKKNISPHVKSIVKPSDIVKYIDPHVWKTTKHSVTENTEFIDTSRGGNIKEEDYKKLTTNKLRVNHYIVRSHQDFLEKLQRGGGSGRVIDPITYENVNKQNIYDDLSLQYIDQTASFLK